MPKNRLSLQLCVRIRKKLYSEYKSNTFHHSAVLKSLDKFIRPEIKDMLGIEIYLDIFGMLHTFIAQILEDLSLSENDYDLNGISFQLKELQTARTRVDMDLLQCLFSFHSVNLSWVADHWVLAELLRNANAKSPAELRMVFRIRRAFSKPLVTINAITKLVNLARSPNISKIFRNFAFRPVYLEGKKAPTLYECIDLFFTFF